MTELIRSQLNIFFVMTLGGMAAGLVLDVFEAFSQIWCADKLGAAAAELTAWITVGFLVSEFMFFCDNGKVSFEGIMSFIAGLLLWKKCFCDILRPVGGDYGKEKFHRKSD